MKAPGPSRSGALLVLTVTLALVFAPPAYAQSSSASAGPDASQYGVTQSNATAGDIPRAFSESVAKGTEETGEAITPGAEEINEAVSGGAAPSGSVPATNADAGSAPPTNTVAAAAGLTSLPETGGAPPVVLCAGACLLGGGLLLVRLSL